MAYQNGSLVRVTGTGPVYVIVLGAACWVPNADTFNNLFVSPRWDTIQDISQSDFDLIPVGPTFSNGAYLAGGPAGTWYVISWGLANPIANPDVVQAYGFNSATVQPVSTTVINGMPRGWLITA